MTIPLKLQTLRAPLSGFLLRYWLPVGWFALLTGMFWVGDRTLYHKLYYLFLAAPTLLVLMLQPRWFCQTARIPLIGLFSAFAAYMLSSFSWSPSEASFASLAKRPFYILLLFGAATLMALRNPEGLARATKWAAVTASISATLTVGYHLLYDDVPRLTGYGALYNPLLSTHVYGFFCVYWLCRWHQQAESSNRLLLAQVPLWLLLLLTGSRTPLMAIAMALLWLAASNWRPRLWGFIASLLTFGVLWQLLQPAQNLLSRGLSYRPAIWTEALRQLEGHSTLGLGLSHPQVFSIPGLDEAMADTHSIALGVMFEGGIVGLGFWLAIYGYALSYAWRQRQEGAVLTASTLVVFGFVASLTEGSAFFSRPKEHWFLLWIPLSMLAATCVARGRMRNAC